MKFRSVNITNKGSCTLDMSDNHRNLLITHSYSTCTLYIGYSTYTVDSTSLARPDLPDVHNNYWGAGSCKEAREERSGHSQ